MTPIATLPSCSRRDQPSAPQTRTKSTCVTFPSTTSDMTTGSASPRSVSIYTMKNGMAMLDATPQTHRNRSSWEKFLSLQRLHQDVKGRPLGLLHRRHQGLLCPRDHCWTNEPEGDRTANEEERVAKGLLPARRLAFPPIDEETRAQSQDRQHHCTCRQPPAIVTAQQSLRNQVVHPAHPRRYPQGREQAAKRQQEDHSRYGEGTGDVNKEGHRCNGDNQQLGKNPRPAGRWLS